jgi:hypothetical protein
MATVARTKEVEKNIQHRRRESQIEKQARSENTGWADGFIKAWKMV